jgi:hypothetical protein
LLHSGFCAAYQLRASNQAKALSLGWLALSLDLS